MTPRRLILSALLAVWLLVGVVVALIGLFPETVSQDSQAEGALSELVAAEARLDADLLRVVWFHLPHYDGVVASAVELRRRRDIVKELLNGDSFRDNKILARSAGYYFGSLERKLDLLEQLKGEAAFLRNQISYVPFAVNDALPALAPGDRIKLLQVSQAMLAFQAHPDDEEERTLVRKLDQAGNLASYPMVGPLLRHVRVYLQHHRSMDSAIKAYSDLDQPGWRQLVRVHLLVQQADDERRVRLIGGLLWLLVPGLLGALAWAVGLLNRARHLAVQSSERLSKAIESMVGGFAVYDKDHRLVLSNRRCGELFAPAAEMLKPGMTFESFVKRLIEADFVAGTAGDPEQVYADTLAKAGTFHSWSLPLRDGRWFQCRHAPTSDGGFICSAVDDTERRRAEDEMRRLITAVEQSPASIVITDTSGAIQYVNPWFSRITGYTQDEVLGQNPRILKSGMMKDEEYADLWRTISDGKVWSGEFCNKKKNGQLYWENASISPVRDENGLVASYVGVKRDVTAEKEIARQLESIISELARSNAELEQFAYVASHDLREPLRMVSSYVGLLARRYAGKLDGDALDFITFAKDGARRMDRLILDLLEYSRIGRVSRRIEEVDLADSLKEALGNLETAIGDTGAKIEVAGRLPILPAAPSDMVRLLQNLVGNAVKYRSPERTPEIRISAEEDAGFWVVSVIDNGIGIAPEYGERVFGIFQRLHAHGEYEGTGIGLAVCRKIVQQHGGRIWVEGRPGEGCCFRFSLPKPPLRP